jgi:hypothetical protein
LAPGKVLPIGGGKDDPAFAGMDLLKKLLSGDPEMEAMIAAEFSKDDDDLLEMFEDDEEDDFGYR